MAHPRIARGQLLPVHPFLLRTAEERVAHLNTYAGMAHFAGSGPAGKTCGECNHWFGQPLAGQAICVMFKRLMRGRAGPKVPRQASACRYFEATATSAPPALDELPMPFGKHRDKPLREVPRDYLIWLRGRLAEAPDERSLLLEAVRHVLNMAPSPPPNP
jgi:hypothetical protein